MADDGAARPTAAHYAVGTAALAAESLRQITRGSARIARRLARRGNEAVAESREQVTATVRGATSTSFDWVATTIAPQLIDRMVPYISKDLAPKLIEQLMPYISDEVAPRLIEQLMPRLTKEVAPQLVEQLMPYLTQEAIPKIMDGAMPYIRTAVMPVILEDLTHDPEVREMIAEQGRGVLTDATMQLRETSATADDRVENGFRRLFHMPQTPQTQG